MKIKINKNKNMKINNFSPKIFINLSKKIVVASMLFVVCASCKNECECVGTPELSIENILLLNGFERTQNADVFEYVIRDIYKIGPISYQIPNTDTSFFLLTNYFLHYFVKVDRNVNKIVDYVGCITNVVDLASHNCTYWLPDKNATNYFLLCPLLDHYAKNAENVKYIEYSNHKVGMSTYPMGLVIPITDGSINNNVYYHPLRLENTIANNYFLYKYQTPKGLYSCFPNECTLYRGTSILDIAYQEPIFTFNLEQPSKTNAEYHLNRMLCWKKFQ